MTELMEALLGEQPRNLRPNFDGPPVEVIANVYISSMDSVEEKTMTRDDASTIRSEQAIDTVATVRKQTDYTVGIYLRQFWQDPRLVFEGLNKTISLDSNIRPKIWVPDLFFVNEKDGKMHAITTANKYIRIHPNGTVLYSMRGCTSNLHGGALESSSMEVARAALRDTPVELCAKTSQFSSAGVSRRLYEQPPWRSSAELRAERATSMEELCRAPPWS
ncbi:Glycine receptor subunit alpha-3 [Branchiostoma belcheri]|nr:Glycine receptor subunit alpha-3 [Branchiostoma belcheri]